MNLFLWIILVSLALDFLIDSLSDYLDIKHLNRELPREFQGVYDPQKYRKSQDYQKANSYFGLIQRSFWFLITLFMILAGGFQVLDSWTRGVVTRGVLGESAIFRGLVFIGALSLAKTIISIPFSIYHTFVIEEKFGFNKTTLKTFFGDMIKGLFLSVILGGLVLSLILYFFEYTGSSAWIYGWIAITLFQLGVSFLAPVFIMPLFNKFKPIEPGELRDAIEKYAHAQKFHLSGIFVMDGSKRSTKSNAFFTVLVISFW